MQVDNCFDDLDFRSFLAQELLVRQERRPKYSLRAFSRDLGTSPSLICNVLKNRRGISEDTAYAILEKLDWTNDKKELFIILVQLSNAKSPSRKQLALEKARNKQGLFQALAVDIASFEFMAQWYHAAILEYLHIKGVKRDQESICQAFSLGKKGEAALRVLLRLQLIGKTDDGLYFPIQRNLQINDIPSEAIRSFHRQNLLRGSQALSQQSINERHFSGTTMAINTKKIPEYMRLIKDFRRQLQEVLQDDECDSVYHFSAQFFRQ
ncbi:MAG: TIGR02147 family protein [Pseudobacteriovorax sp.]|nr:TIGR02147 family protein [Pseudobacteriovorax sp.]